MGATVPKPENNYVILAVRIPLVKVLDYNNNLKYLILRGFTPFIT